MTLLVILVFFYKSVYPGLGNQEGFTQTPVISQRYLLKRNQDIYDDFYVQLYDEVHLPQTFVEKQVDLILQMTMPSVETSVLLDVGTGKGHVLTALRNRGFYNVYGMDKSEAMIQQSVEKDRITCGDVLEPNTFDRITFSHILCLNHTLYELENSMAFFRNSYHWLKSGGYLMVQLTEDRLPSTETKEVAGLVYRKTVERTTTDTQHILVKETFVDKNTQNIRENEQILLHKDMGDILNEALYCGFQVKGKVVLNNPEPGSLDKPEIRKEYLYVFQK